MRLQRAGEKEIHIFFTKEELEQFGISVDEGGCSAKWEQMLLDLLSAGKDDWNICDEGTFYIEVEFVEHVDDVLLITMKWKDEDVFESDWIENDDGMDELHFCFHDVEHLIQLANRLRSDYSEGELFFYEGRYHLLFPVLYKHDYEKLKAIFSEYGKPAVQPISQIYHQGKKLIGTQAISELNRIFYKR